jgi:1,5-anhydro-D-fructose reductase (1,5-anhydro-D-mannitol-forming)
MKSVSEPIRWGIAGPGWVASDFIAPAMTDSPRSRIVACVGSSAEKGRAFAAKFGFTRVHESVEGLMNDPDVDAVYIALPNAMHHAAVLAGARAGKHLLCEKPFALSVAHAREMLAACTEAGIVLRIAHQIRTDAAVRRAGEIARSGALGRLASITLQRSSVITPRDTWRADATQSGVIYDVCVHLLDLGQWLTGHKIVEVTALSHPDRRSNVPDDTITILGRTDKDCHVIARATREAPHAGNNLIIEGWEGTLTTSPLRWMKEHVVSVKTGSGTAEEKFPASPAYAFQVHAFEAELLRGERSVLPDGEDVLHTVAVTQAAIQSILERRTVTVVPG